MQPADLAIALRQRTAWEAMDLGLSMLQKWWRLVYVPHLIVAALVAGAAFAAGGWLERPWVALVAVWWMKPGFQTLSDLTCPYTSRAFTRVDSGNLLTLEDV